LSQNKFFRYQVSLSEPLDNESITNGHLHQRDHRDAFWNEVDKVLPDYRERKEWLRVRGATLDL
jgi:hypothetical protein